MNSALDSQLYINCPLHRKIYLLGDQPLIQQLAIFLFNLKSIACSATDEILFRF